MDARPTEHRPAGVQPSTPPDAHAPAAEEQESSAQRDARGGHSRQRNGFAKRSFPSATAVGTGTATGAADVRPGEGGAKPALEPLSSSTLSDAAPLAAAESAASQPLDAQGATGEAAAKAKGGEAAPARAPQRALAAAWARALASGPTRTDLLAGGWKVLQMPLRQGDGTVTIKARREEDQMAVAVGFSDAKLRAQAAASPQHLHDALQAQYEGAVDFSLMDGGESSGSFDERAASPSAGDASAPAEREDGEEQPPPARTGARHEWIG